MSTEHAVRTQNPGDPSRILRLRQRIAQHPNHRRWLLWTCLAGGFATTFTITILGVSLRTIARPISFSASSPVGGHLGSIYGERLMVISGSIFIFVAMLAFAAGAAQESILFILAGLIFAGLGMGLAQPSLNTLVASAVSEHDHGIAVSTMSTTSGIGAVAGISILTALCADAESGSAFRDGYALGAVVAAIGVAASFALRAVDHDSPTHDAGESLEEDVLASVA